MEHTFDVKYLAAATICASREETRYFMQGVFVEMTEAGTRFVATDGRRQIALFDERVPGANNDTILASAIIPLKICTQIKVKKVRGLFRKKEDNPNEALLRVEANRITIDVDGVSIGVDGIDGTYPHWRSVIPKEVSGEGGTFNGKYLADFNRIAKIFGVTSCPLISHNGKDPAIVHLPLGVKGVGVIMPFRNSPPDWTIPDWIGIR